jgi:glycosyltransferase involved in cell wall biosynthesis
MGMVEKFGTQPISNEKQAVPTVSIGMPVYNGEAYIRQAIDSVISQTFTDFELVISDNCSTDGTEMICKEYIKKDSRIKYIQQPVNIGAINNFNFLLKHARGLYFTWLTCDDFLDASFLEVIVQYLDKHADVALCFSDSSDVKNGTVVRKIFHNNIRDNIDWTIARRIFFTWKHRHVLAIYGIYRLRLLHENNIYFQPGFTGMSFGAEHSILARVALQGKIVALPVLLRYETKHDESLSESEAKSVRALKLLVNILYTSIKYQARVAFLSKLGLRHKLQLYGEMLMCNIPILFYYTLLLIPIRFYRRLYNQKAFYPLMNRFMNNV